MLKKTKKLFKYTSVCIASFLIIIFFLLVITYKFDIGYEKIVENDNKSYEIVTLLSSRGKGRIKHMKVPAGLNRNKLELEEDVTNDAVYENILDSVIPTQQQAAQLYEAEEMLAKQCMNERGFKYIPNTADDDLVSVDPVERGDVTIAETRGYGIAENIAFEEKVGSDTLESVNSDSKPANLFAIQSNTNDAHLSSLSEDEQQKWHEALMGKVDMGDPLAAGEEMISVEDPSTGGAMYWDAGACLTSARRELYDSDIRYIENLIATQTLQKKIIDFVGENTEFKKAFSQWKSCMTENGLPNEYFGEAADVLSSRYYKGELNIDELKAEEIKMASIDASCYQQNDLDNVLASAENKAEEQLWVENSERIIELQKSLSTAVEKSKRY